MGSLPPSRGRLGLAAAGGSSSSGPGNDAARTLFFLSPDLIGANDVVHVLDVRQVSGLSPPSCKTKHCVLSKKAFVPCVARGNSLKTVILRIFFSLNIVKLLKMASRNQRERRAPERYGVISIGIPFDGENSDLELEDEEIELAGKVGSSTNPVYSSSKEGGEEEKILNLQVFVSVPIHQKAMELQLHIKFVCRR